MLPKTMIFVSCMLAPSVLSSEYAFLENCPGVQKPVVITNEILNKYVFFSIQSHDPKQWLYRKKFSYGRASKGIGTDPKIDFKNKKTAVFLDGYLDSTNYPFARSILGNYAELGYNTISVDAMAVYFFIYNMSARIGYQVGNFTAVVLNNLMQYGLRPEDIELIGISLGGQTVSFVAKYFTQYSGRKVGRIYSMDPAGPCYRNLGPSGRLAPTDADLVQVLHTASEGFGMGEAVGHLDFYFNGGEYQFLTNTYQPWAEDLMSHVAGFLYFLTSLRFYPDKFVGVKCENVQQAREHRCYENLPVVTNLLGPKADPSKPGIYYIPVTANYPFFAPNDFIEKKINYNLIYNDALSNVKHFVIS